MVPENVQQEIVAIAQEKHPKRIAVLQLATVYERKYKKEFRPELYGFECPNELLKTIKQIELHHDELLALWFLAYNPNAAVEVKSTVNGSTSNGKNHSSQKNGALCVILEDVEMSAPVPCTSTRNRPKLPDIPAPPETVSSMASTASGGTRSRRLPPPPPPPTSIDWSSDSKSVSGKRQGSVVEPAAKRFQRDDDTNSVISVCSVDESVPQQDKKKMETDRRTVRYIPQYHQLERISYDSLVLGKKVGAVEPAAYVDTTFCPREILEQLMDVKYDVKKAGPAAFEDFQKRLNNFVHPPTMFHFNKAYLYANIDALTGFSLTNPTFPNGKEIVEDNELLYAVDIQGGPGGFVEYVLTKKKWEAKVYGYSYIDDVHKYRIPPTGHFPTESFEQWSGLGGKRGDGSIYKPHYVDIFSKFVRRNTDYKGVHVVVADGSETTSGLDEDRKELRVKPMILAEAFIAMKILRKGGTFVLRLYDVFTLYTAGLIYLLYRAFENVAIIRPEACLQASAERFLVCKHFRGGQLCTEIVNYLSTLHGMDFGCHVNHKFPNEEQAEIVELVPLEMMKDAKMFYKYICESNCEIGKMQLEETHNLCLALKFKHEERLVSKRKNTIRFKCSEVWNCPRRLRQESKYASLSPELFLRKLLRPYPENVLNRTELEGENLLSYTALQEDFQNPQDWHFVSVGRDRGFYMGRGGDKVYRFSGGHWKLLNDSMNIADQTLVYGDLVDEIINFEEKQITQTAFHIIDGMILGGKDIRNLAYTDRMDMCAKFAKSMCKPSLENLVLIRAKIPQESRELEQCLKAVHKQLIKGYGDGKKRALVPVADQKSAVYANTGYLFMRTAKKGDVPADFFMTMQNRLYWRLDDNMDRNPSGPVPDRPDSKRLATTSVDAPTLTRHVANNQMFTATGTKIN